MEDPCTSCAYLPPPEGGYLGRAGQEEIEVEEPDGRHQQRLAVLDTDLPKKMVLGAGSRMDVGLVKSTMSTLF